MNATLIDVVRAADRSSGGETDRWINEARLFPHHPLGQTLDTTLTPSPKALMNSHLTNSSNQP
jgi:hypothetical protein